MTTMTARGYPRRERRPVSADHVLKSAGSIGFLAVALYQAGAPHLGYVTTSATGYIVAGSGLVLGALLGLWK